MRLFSRDLVCCAVRHSVFFDNTMTTNQSLNFSNPTHTVEASVYFKATLSSAGVLHQAANAKIAKMSL